MSRNGDNYDIQYAALYEVIFDGFVHLSNNVNR